VTRLLDTFLDLARIDSPPGRERAVAEYVASALSDAGCSVRFDDTRDQTGANVGNLIARLPGTAPGPVVAFSAHMDCVQPCEGVDPVVTDGVIRSAGDTILGGDDKVGVAAIVEAVRRLSAEQVPHPEVLVLLTVSEEMGLVGAKALSARDAAADLCLVLDADGAVGGIVTAAPTHYTFKATFQGRAAHAGVEPEKGVSAIVMAADAVTRMQLGRLDERTTANIGVIEGGSATNVVAGSCKLTGECRSLDADRADEVRAAMDVALRAAAADKGGSVEIAWQLEYRGFTVAEGEQPLSLVEAAMADIGVEPRCFATGGGSDGNILSALGVPTLVLSSGMSKVHSIDEELEVVQLERLADLLVAVARRAAE
jgi:tripeptide aminopeptidase